MRVGVLSQPHHAALRDIMDRLRAAASENGVDLVLTSDLMAVFGGEGPALDERLEGVDFLLTLGGDGTLLKGARLAGPRDVPVVGCNLGKLGFLTSVPLGRLEELLHRLRERQYEEEARLALEVGLHPTEGPAGMASAEPTESFYALNDAVVHKGGFARLISMRVWVNEEEIGQYSADGIVLATATGSTAYSLSAGGPILFPSLDALVATPICPHSMSIRPVVVPADTTINVEILSRMDGILVTVDGQSGGRLGGGGRVSARRSPHPVRLIRMPDQNFFSVLRQKMRWGDVRPAAD
ncbi:MAG: NAD(+)/NADH kinase [Candidatus Palauibacterales bacterium]|jgi:NAD+ kinase|nr:NAD(+)/NADH kinase [Candidatus Palauibacterales bacterium]MDP2483166.1 NAD(+)/NADH kinase [Candidatus Palauibacterales bacterium]